MRREPDMDSAAYRDKKINEEYQQRINPKRPTEGELLNKEGVGEDGGFIDDGTLDAEGNVQAISMEDIQSDIVKQKQLRDAQRNKEYDQKMREIEASGVTGRAKAAALKEANRLRTGDTGINPADIPDNALQAFNSLATAVAEDPLTAAEELIEMKRAHSFGTGVAVATDSPLAGTVAGVTWYAGEQLYDFLETALRRRVYATAGGPALPVGKTSYDQIIAQGGAILRSATRNINKISGGGGSGGGASKRYNWRDIKGNKLWKSGQPDPKVTSKVDSILGMMDDWRLSHSDLERPMTGFVKHYGRKPTFWQDGKEWGIGWSRKKNNYEIFDVKARIDSRAKRLAGDKTSSNYSYKLRQIKEALVRDLNKQSKELPVEQWDIMIQNPGDAYKEHLIAIDSPFWKSKRGKNAGYLAGDSKNLKVLTDQNFKTLKDKVETHVHAKHKDLYVDYDPISQNIILRNLETGKALDTQIPGIGDPTKAKEYVADALAGKPMQSLETINPKTPSNVHRQIQKAYFADLDDITANAIIDRIKGASWTEIRKTYGKDFSKRQLSLATNKYNKLTKSQVMAIMKAYNISGKGKPGTY